MIPGGVVLVIDCRYDKTAGAFAIQVAAADHAMNICVVSSDNIPGTGDILLGRLGAGALEIPCRLHDEPLDIPELPWNLYKKKPRRSGQKSRPYWKLDKRGGRR